MKNTKLKAITLALLASAFMLAACAPVKNADPSPSPKLWTEVPTGATSEAPTAAPTDVPTENPVETSCQFGYIIIDHMLHTRFYSHYRNNFCDFMPRKTLDIGSPCGRLLPGKTKKPLVVKLFCPVCWQPYGDRNLCQEFRGIKKHPVFAGSLRFWE